MASPIVTLPDLSLKEYKLTEPVRELSRNYFRAMPQVCIERARLVTGFSRERDLFRKDPTSISILEKARVYREVLTNRKPIVRHTHAYEKGEEGVSRFTLKDAQLFAGSTTGKFKGVPLFPEFMGLSIWPELWNLPRRARNPYHINASEVMALNYEIFPQWIHRNILEIARKKCAALGFTKDLKVMERVVFFLLSKPDCISHTIPDFSRAVEKGIGEIRDDAKKKARSAGEKSKSEFYEAVAEVLEGVIAYSRNLSQEARRLARREKDPQEREELLKLAEIHSKVPESPAETFREALTTMWICLIAVHLENPDIGISLGRMDQVLYPLYRKQIERGDLTVEEAIELLCCFWLKLGDHVPMVPESAEQLFGGAGSNQAITIGGVDEKGKDAVNDLTYVILKTTELMGLRDPNLNARYCAGENRPEYLRRVCEVNVKTRATPAIHNDLAVFKALEAKGDTPVEAVRDYAIVGCVEPVSAGTYGSTGSVIFNLTAVLELALFNGRHRHVEGGKELISEEAVGPGTFGSFAKFRKFFEWQARWLADRAMNLNGVLGKVHQEFYPTPILSAFFKGPMEKGMDLVQAGANINSSGVTVIGLADVADSLSAIEAVVFAKRNPVPFMELLEALKADFKEHEPLLERLRKKAPKYGAPKNGQKDVAQENVKWILELMDSAFALKNGAAHYRGGHYRVGYWTMTNHAAFGKLLGATPNGRLKGENFSSGITPVSGATPALLQVLNSAADLPAARLSNGVGFNLKFTCREDDPRAADEMAAKVKGCFDGKYGARDGAMEIQFNVIPHDHLVRVHENPDIDPHLLVRVSGYTAYFKDLTPQMRVEIINRTEYNLSTGKAKSFPVVAAPV